jgi:hypothetical protein
MRITRPEAKAVKETGNAIFGERTVVWLFGTRADNALKEVNLK